MTKTMNHTTPVDTQIKNYLRRYIDITDTEFEQFKGLTKRMDIGKGETLLDFDRKCNYQFFIISGLLVSFNINEKGEEKAIQISTENTWTGDLDSYLFNKPTSRIIKSYERSELLLLNKGNWNKLLEANAKYEKLFRILFQNAYIAQTNRVQAGMKFDAKERLKDFTKENPHLLKRVQKKIIASYLNMTPETLSRLIKKHSS
jgi:CRP-like cAMP-binding protein